MMSSRSLDDLHPWVRAKAREFLKKCQDADQLVLIYDTLRTPEEQAAKHAEGTSQIKSGGPHEFGLAFDCIPIHKNGKLWWQAPDEVWQIIYQIGEDCGLDALGDKWGEFLRWDRGHFQEPGWRLVKDL